MTTLAYWRGWWNAAASNRITFAALLMARRLHRALKRRSNSMRVARLPDYLLADIGLRRSDLATATILGRSRL